MDRARRCRRGDQARTGARDVPRRLVLDVLCREGTRATLASIDTTSYFRLTEPGLPAFVFLAAAIVLPRPRAAPSSSRLQPRPLPRWALAVTASSVARAARSRRWRRAQPAPRRPSAIVARSTEAPISAALTAHARAPRSLARRSTATARMCTTSSSASTRHSGGCTAPVRRRVECLFAGRRSSTNTPRRSRGHAAPATYRIAAAANYRQTGSNGGDLMLLGPPVAVRSRRASFASSSASRCARTTFWSDSREITVE